MTRAINPRTSKGKFINESLCVFDKNRDCKEFSFPKVWKFRILYTPWIMATKNMVTPRCRRLYNKMRKRGSNLDKGPMIRIICRINMASEPKALIIKVSIVISGLRTKLNSAYRTRNPSEKISMT
jgi:hypothetical protein